MELLLRLGEVREAAKILRRRRKKGKGGSKGALSEKDQEALEQLEATIINFRFTGEQLRTELLQYSEANGGG